MAQAVPKRDEQRGTNSTLIHIYTLIHMSSQPTATDLMEPTVARKAPGLEHGPENLWGLFDCLARVVVQIHDDAPFDRWMLF